MSCYLRDHSLPIPCTVFHYVDTEHVSQVFTGLRALAENGVIRIRQRPWRDIRPNVPVPISGRWFLLIELEGARACFDLNDGSGIDERLLATVDFYFKRSFEPERYSTNELRHRIHPLGFNYAVYKRNPDIWAVQRMLQGSAGFRSVFRRLGLGLTFFPSVQEVESPPSAANVPSVLFYTRLWDPHASSGERAAEAREIINQSRVACVRALKSAFGDAFVGGIEPSPVALQLCPELVAGSQTVEKRAYLRLVKSVPICVTTTGLHGSNGWKLGEYVACARAIVTEPLIHQVPGNFQAGSNYLRFVSPEDCVEQCRKLLDDAALRDRMMRRNREYYMSYLRPDVLLRNALSKMITDP